MHFEPNNLVKLNIYSKRLLEMVRKDFWISQEGQFAVVYSSNVWSVALISSLRTKVVVVFSISVCAISFLCLLHSYKTSKIDKDGYRNNLKYWDR